MTMIRLSLDVVYGICRGLPIVKLDTKSTCIHATLDFEDHIKMQARAMNPPPRPLQTSLPKCTDRINSRRVRGKSMFIERCGSISVTTNI